MRHNKPMRIAPLLLIAACTGQTAPSTLPSHNTAVTPADDLKETPPTKPADDGHLTVKDPRGVDLDVIRIRAVPKGMSGDVEMETVSTTDLFNAAVAATKSGATEGALTKFRQLVSEFPDSGFAPVAMFDIAAIYDGR